jgi:hydrogenase/urease accessory protein HupE
MNRFPAKSGFPLCALAAAAVLCKPSVAAAHLVTTGMGPVYDGIGHLLLSPEDLVPALAVALYAGLRGRTAGRWILFVFPPAWLLGGMAGLLVNSTPGFPLATISFLLLGALIAADLPLPAPVVSGLAVAVGILHGYGNGIAMQEGPGISGLAGIMATLFVLAALVSAVVVSLRPAWTRVAVRVTGSWIAAVGLLMLGWLAKGSG